MSDIISVLLGQDPDLDNAELRSYSADGGVEERSGL